MDKKKLKTLETSVKSSFIFILLLLVILLLFYWSWFQVINQQHLSTDPNSWGVFGDFVGGLLNPLVALFAFFWLTKSIILQKEDLLATRNALVKTQETQEKQTEISKREIQIAFYNAELEKINLMLNSKLSYRNIIIDNAFDGNNFSDVFTEFGEQKNARIALEECNNEIQTLQIKQKDLLEKIALTSKIDE